MSCVVSVTHTSPVALASAATAAGPAQTTAGLLPPPAAGSPDTGDAINMLLQMSSQISEQQMQIGKSQAAAAEGQRKAAAAQRKEALDRAIEAARKAREAQEDSGGIFSFVTDNVGVVGLIGLATFNWGLVAADIAAHKAELTGNQTNLLDVGAALYAGPLGYMAMEGAKKLAPEELGGQAGAGAAVLGGPMGFALERAASKIIPDDYKKSLESITTVKDDDVRLANKIALMVAMAAVAATSVVLSGGTSTPAVVALVGIGISTTTQIAAETGALKEVVGEKAAVYVALGGAITGAALTLGTSIYSVAGGIQGTASTMKSVTTVAGAAVSVADGASTAMAGMRALERADLEHDADIANADAEAQRHVLSRIEKIIDGILEDIKDAKESAERSAEILNATLQTNNQTLLQAASIKV